MFIHAFFWENKKNYWISLRIDWGWCKLLVILTGSKMVICTVLNQFLIKFKNSFSPQKDMYKHYLLKYFGTFTIFIDCAMIECQKHQLITACCRWTCSITLFVLWSRWLYIAPKWVQVMFHWSQSGRFCHTGMAQSQFRYPQCNLQGFAYLKKCVVMFVVPGVTAIWQSSTLLSQYGLFQ